MNTKMISHSLVTPTRSRTASRLIRMLQESETAIGDLIPSERALAEKLQTSRTTVRQVFEEFKRKGHFRKTANGRQILAKQFTGNLAGPGFMRRTIAIVTSFEIDFEVGRSGHRGFLAFAGAEALQQIRASSRHALVFQPSDEPDGGIADLVDNSPAGVLLVLPPQHSAACQSWAASLRAAAIPVVALGPGSDLPDIDTVDSDHCNGACQLTRHLIGQGCRHILRYLGPKKDDGDLSWWQHARNSGHEMACQEAGVSVMPPLRGLPLAGAPGSSLGESFEDRVTWMVGQLFPLLHNVDNDKQPDAIMVPSDGDVIPVAAACRRFGLIPGEDILVVGYDNYWAGVPERDFDSAVPSATIDRNLSEVGCRMVELLVQRIEGNETGPPRHVLVEPQLVVLSEDNS